MEEEIKVENIKKEFEEKYKIWMIEKAKQNPEEVALEAISSFDKLLECEKTLAQIKFLLKGKNKEVAKMIDEYFSNTY